MGWAVSHYSCQITLSGENELIFQFSSVKTATLLSVTHSESTQERSTESNC